jgi:hypothetical protein
MTVAGTVKKGSREGTRSARTQNIDNLVKGFGQLSEKFLPYGIFVTSL